MPDQPQKQSAGCLKRLSPSFARGTHKLYIKAEPMVLLCKCLDRWPTVSKASRICTGET
ncbi:uncharacterized protein SETTUDRAFT_167503 [Exserohilum turcica Et28A]|uniref:Uncharacterized protein n=1 Tax=Exserohilum turcicum (strain 28A) TaxID=671987 RepID=R0KKN7_EXST2|nr:uncharacterized protein SETTUDRAFT_167503 [Exserohilum turcica Et28A]EOA89679.1 hypothetical protein SETTUDRAFT_167503 [Exserohilum turcica Et28A]